MTNDELNKIGAIILDAAITIHKEPCPGLLESDNELALMQELRLGGSESNTSLFEL